MRHDKVGEGEIVATFYDLHSEIWSASPAAQSIKIGLEAVESLKLPADKDIDLLQWTFKENNNVKLGEKEDFGDEVIAVVSATSSIFCYSYWAKS